MDDAFSLLSPGWRRLQQAVLIIDLSPQIGVERIKPGRADLKPFDFWTNNKACSLLLSEGLKFCTRVSTLKAFKAQIFLLPICWWGIFCIFLNFKVKSPYLSGLVSQTFNWCLFYEFTDYCVTHCQNPISARFSPVHIVICSLCFDLPFTNPADGKSMFTTFFLAALIYFLFQMWPYQYWRHRQSSFLLKRPNVCLLMCGRRLSGRS